jgi:hypothetical protein
MTGQMHGTFGPPGLLHQMFSWALQADLVLIEGVLFTVALASFLHFIDIVSGDRLSRWGEAIGWWFADRAKRAARRKRERQDLAYLPGISFAMPLLTGAGAITARPVVIVINDEDLWPGER